MIQHRQSALFLVLGILAIALPGQDAQAWRSKDGTLNVNGFVDNTTHYREGGNRKGLSKVRNRAQLEFTKILRPVGPFSDISISGTLRGTYDAVYDLNDSDYGDEAGGPVYLQSGGASSLAARTGLPFLSQAPWGALPGPPLTGIGAIPTPGTNPALAGTSPYLNGFFLGPAGGMNPNEGLRILGSDSYTATGGAPGFGLQFATPVRPCNVDSRGCIKDYMDADEDNLRFAEFNDRLDWLREIYIDATVPFDNGAEMNFRIGRQQVVWGRTDLFRVLDVVNPFDASIQNIFEEFEDSRIPMGIFSSEYRLGATDTFDDLNFQFIWKFEQFRPNNLGQGGQPYSILGAGYLFRALATCWQVGCTVGNLLPNGSFGLNALGLRQPGAAFSTGGLAVTFPAHTIGIRSAMLPDWELDNSDIGFRIEGVFKGVGFSANMLYYHSQNPSLHGGNAGPATINPFLCDPALDPVSCGAGVTPIFAPPPAPPGTLVAVIPGAEFLAREPYLSTRARPYSNSFDIHFPRILLVGASADFYVEALKSAFRVEVAHTNGEQFANTLAPGQYSRSKVVRWVVGWDRPTFIRALNRNRSFNISAQMFGQHLLDHEYIKTPAGPAGFSDWEDNFFATLLIQTGYLNDRVQPRVIAAYDFEAQAAAIGPAIDWLINDNWRLVVGANLKFGRAKNPFDDCGTCNIYPPFTDPLEGTPGAGTPASATGQTGFRTSSINPLGLFRAGPIGNAQNEDEFQILLRYRF